MALPLKSALVTKALILLEADPARAWTVGEIASACGVGRRTLQRHFRRVVGRMPMAFVRDLRLDRARRELLCASARVNVTKIAARCGFNHFGRFAAQYRERFGEAPSVTLRRLQSLPIGTTRHLPPLPVAVDRPRIAVLPFDMIGADTSNASVLTDEINAALVRVRWVGIGTPATARYQLRGKVRRDGAGRLHVTALLFDAPAGRYLWADRWDGDGNEQFGFEERIAGHIATAIQPTVRESEIDRAWREDEAGLNAWELTMRALPRVLTIDAAAEEMALEALQRAIEIAPNDPLPLALAAWCHGLRGCHNLCARPDADKTAALVLAKRAASLRNGDALTETFLAAGYTLAHDLATAAVHANRALALDGGSAWAWGRIGWLKTYSGEFAEAIECFQTSQTLGPADSMGFLCSVGIAAGHFGEGRYEDSVCWFERALAENPAATWINHALAPAYALGGHKEQARRSMAEAIKAFPDLTIAQVRSGLPYRSSYLDRVAEGLESAGMR